MKYIFSTEQLEKAENCRWLSDRERKIFDLYFRRKWRIEDIAAELEVSRRTVSADLKHIREMCI